MKRAVLAAGLIVGASSASANDQILEFKIENALNHLLMAGASVDARASGYRVEILVGFSDPPANFSDLMWDAAARASIISNQMVTVRAVTRPFAFTSNRSSQHVCFVKARKGQVFDASC